MNRIVIGALLAGELVSTTTFAKRPVDDLSWGKAGVGYEQYRADAIRCGRVGASQDVTKQEAGKAVIRGVERQDNDLSGGGNTLDQARDYALTARRSRFKENVATVQTYMVGSVEACLVESGYVRFRLTGEQLDRLRRYRPGTEERFRFMHSLAADPELVGQQEARPE